MTAENEFSYSLSFPIEGRDFLNAGEASSQVKERLKKLGISSQIIRRAAIVAYEAEMNVVIHAYQGTLKADLNQDRIMIITEDQGPGIEDINLAMQEGFSTVSEDILEMGFGAGMGLPNIKRFSDSLQVDSEVGKGTVLKAIIKLK